MTASAVRRAKLAALAGGLAFTAYQLLWNFGEDFRPLKLLIAAGAFCVVAVAVYGALLVVESK